MSRMKYDYWKRKEVASSIFTAGRIIEAPTEKDLIATYGLGEIYNSDGDILT